ncbi:hypothetical protein [Acuticoccus mangrovi]|uniref:Uncharacterized protein n=1 Tax=Acuticoccus mangrovi TaxID=2796142 RepID=A0A934ISJ3_9HYPH|nr:hypothetical protein [Acuticoccus mangrovi]MBJ3777255.1 hypothetical protein [Acuticoccus mangrovi]
MAACAVHDADQAEEGKSVIVGMSKTEVRMCAGFPTKTLSDDKGEIWSYERVITGGRSIALPTVPIPTPTSIMLPGPQFSQGSGAYCHAQVRFKKDHVVEVAYAGATDMMGASDAACGQIVQGCIGYRPPM